MIGSFHPSTAGLRRPNSNRSAIVNFGPAAVFQDP